MKELNTPVRTEDLLGCVKSETICSGDFSSVGIFPEALGRAEEKESISFVGWVQTDIAKTHLHLWPVMQRYKGSLWHLREIREMRYNKSPMYRSYRSRRLCLLRRASISNHWRRSNPHSRVLVTSIDSLSERNAWGRFTWHTAHRVNNGIAQGECIDDFLCFIRIDDSDHRFVIRLGRYPNDRR